MISENPDHDFVFYNEHGYKGVGLLSESGSRKVYSRQNGEAVSMELDDPADRVELTLSDLSNNNAGAPMTFRVFFSDDANDYQDVTINVLDPAPGDQTFILDAANLNGDEIHSIAIEADISFLIQKVNVVNVADDVHDTFKYTIQDADGDEASTVVTFSNDEPSFPLSTGGDDMITNGIGQTEMTGGSGADTFLFLAGSDTDGSVTNYDAGEGDVLDVSDLLIGSNYIPGVSDVEDYVKVDSDTGDVHIDTTGGGNFSNANVVTSLDGPSTISTVNMVLDKDEGEVSVNPVA